MFIAKKNDLIILAKETREELEHALTFMPYTTIEETNIEYELYNGEYLTKEEVQEKEKEARIEEIKKELNELDIKSIRAIRTNDTAYLEKYEQEAQVLREELRSLQ